MNKVKKYIYISVGLISFALGAIGVILPVLPTTPFLLLASFCFAKGSERFHKWFTESKIYKKHLESFVREKAMTLKQKIMLLAFADFMMAFPLIMLDSLHVKIFLVVLILLKFYYFIFKIKTIKPVKEGEI
ncbi:MAG: YbaN family protein [Clostridium perfringens]|nr:YbaN family protein [Clostridium perfringens]